MEQYLNILEEQQRGPS